MDAALKRGDWDLDAMEEALRALVLGKAAQGLGRFMTAVGLAKPEGKPACAHCQTSMESTGRRTKRILTLVGETAYTRSRYECPSCGAVRHPGDEALGVVGTLARTPTPDRAAGRERGLP